MIITLNIPNKQLFEKILWLLNCFKNDGVEIIIDEKKPNSISDNSVHIEKFKQVIAMKSKNSIKVEKHIILNPHNELSNDIS